MPAKRHNGNGNRCRVCGVELGCGSTLAGHLSKVHGLDPAAYRKCFPGRAFEVLLDEWDETDADAEGHPIVTHVLVRRFVDRSRKAVPRGPCRCFSASAVWTGPTPVSPIPSHSGRASGRSQDGSGEGDGV